MSSHHSLALALRDILQVINPTQDDWTKRFHIIDEIRAVVATVDVLNRGATVEPFGSFVSNLFTRWGDLDLSIELPNGSYISAAGKKYKQTLLLDVLKALRRKGGFYGIKYISHARVPILKCESNKDNISCDISINNLSGQMKSKLLFWISDIDNRFRDMVLLVKEWAKAHGINDPKTGTLNSYSLTLLIIFHFQTCEPAILPPLSEIYPGNMAAELVGVRADAEKNIEDICGQNIKRIKLERSRRINRTSLADLFISFLAKFCDISLRAATQGISPYNGQWEDINTNMIWQPKTYAVFIEDPFEQPMNCARAVSSRNLLKIAQAFQTSHQKLTAANPSNPLTVLVRPEVLSIFARSQAASSSTMGMSPLRMQPQVHRNPIGNNSVRGPMGAHLQQDPYRNTSINGNQNRNGGRSQVHRGARPPTQVQEPQQQYIHHNHPNSVIHQRPFHGSQSQGQVMFFPRTGVNQRPENGAGQVQGNPGNGGNQRPGSGQVQGIPGNGANHRPGPSRRRWRPRSEK